MRQAAMQIRRRGMTLPAALAVAAALIGAAPAHAADWELGAQILGPLTSQGSDSFATQAIGAGDLNGDGYDDVATLDASTPDKQVHVVFGASSLTGVNTGAPGNRGIAVFTTPPTGLLPARSISAAGDVDGDGFDDLIVGGMPSWIVYGAADFGPVAPAPGPRVTELQGRDAGDARGIGDFDGDGRPDVASGRRRSPNSSTMERGFAIYRGGPRLQAVNLWTASTRTIPVVPRQRCGFTQYLQYTCNSDAMDLTPLGDVNGDGRTDLGVTNAQSVAQYIVLGRPGSATIATSGTPSPVITITNASRYTFVGASAAPGEVGDTTGDGIDDIAVGTVASPNPVLIVPGSRTATQIDPATQPVRRIERAGPVSSFETYEPVGDVTGDGRDDLIAYASAPAAPWPGGGAVGIIPGAAAGTVIRVTDLAPLSGFATPGLSSAEAAGDVDGDGDTDLILGQRTLTRPGEVMRGGAQLIVRTTGTTPAPRPELALSEVDRTATETTVRIRNTGNAAGTITSVTPSPGWALASAPVTPFVVPVGGSRDIRVTLGSSAGTVTVQPQDGFALRIDLAGATPPPPPPPPAAFTVTPSTISRTARWGQTVRATVTVTNPPGAAARRVEPWLMTTGPRSDAWWVSAATCGQRNAIDRYGIGEPILLAPGQSCTVELSFRPTSYTVSRYTGSVLIGGTTPALRLSGTLRYF